MKVFTIKNAIAEIRKVRPIFEKDDDWPPFINAFYPFNDKFMRVIFFMLPAIEGRQLLRCLIVDFRYAILTVQFHFLRGF